jgi:hypothetical protein
MTLRSLVCVDEERHDDIFKAYPIGVARNFVPRLFVVVEGRRASVTDLGSGQVYSS